MKTTLPVRRTNQRLNQQDAAVDMVQDGEVMVAGDEFATLDTIALSSFAIPVAAPTETISDVPADFTNDAGLMSWIAAMSCLSPSAGPMLAEAAEEGWVVGISDLSQGGYHIDASRRLLVLDNEGMNSRAVGASAFFRHSMLLSFIRALRDIGHEKRLGAFESIYAPDHSLIIERVRSADCDVAVILAGWELRGAGHTDIWRHILGSAEGDMAMIFSRYLERSPSALFDGSALAYAFRQWFADDTRVNACEHAVLEMMDDILEDSDVHNPFGQKSVTVAEVEAMSILPDGICYLAGIGNTIMRDPFFAGLKDIVNQTHFFHIMYDLSVTLVNNVPFRDSKLARMIFPNPGSVKTLH